MRIGIDTCGKPIYKWATGSSKQELFLNVAKVLCESGCVSIQTASKGKHPFKVYAQHWFEVFKKPTVRPLTALTYSQQLEGYLYPDQYDFYLNEDPESIIFKMLRNYDQKITERNSFNGYDELSTVQKMAENSEYSLDEIMVIASIIQDEAADENDMYTISSIIHNRLDADVDMGVSNLGLDSTKYYPYASKEDVPDSEGDDYVSKYDTYSKAGLPAGPICNPRIEAIKAALCPNDTSYYYFCHDSEGNAYYASTMYEHEQNLENLE